MFKMSDLHWAAGFLEGEGCFMALNSRRRSINSAPYWIPVVDVAQVNREPLHRLQSLFGGKIVDIKPTGNRQLAGLWRLNGRKAIGLMMTLWLLMSERRRGQIELAIERWKANKGQSGAAYLATRARGESNGNAKLKPETVREIRASSESQSVLAKRYLVSGATISNIRARRAWSHVL